MGRHCMIRGGVFVCGNPLNLNGIEMITKQELSVLIGAELGLSVSQTRAVLDLLDESATVPFIARYRKERTGGLDEVQIRAIEERRDYLNEMS